MTADCVNLSALRELPNKAKELLGETRASLTLERAGYKQLESKLPSNNGFDGVFVKYGADGNPLSIIITESKFSSSGYASLSDTNMGKQLSKAWFKVILIGWSSYHLEILNTAV